MALFKRRLYKFIIGFLLLNVIIWVPIYLSPSRHLPFSTFLSEEWKSQRELLLDRGILTILHTNAADGGNGVDTYNIMGQGITLIDGVLSVRFEVYNFENKAKNTIVILAPGLADIDNNILTIKADIDLDRIILDGCLRWRGGHDNGKNHPLQAMDANNEIRTIILPKIMNVKIEKHCNNRYLLRYDKAIKNTLN